MVKCLRCFVRKFIYNKVLELVFKRIFEYIRIFEYFPPNIDVCIPFVTIFKAEYYSNIRIFFTNISEYWSLEKLELRSFIYHF